MTHLIQLYCTGIMIRSLRQKFFIIYFRIIDRIKKIFQVIKTDYRNFVFFPLGERIMTQKEKQKKQEINSDVGTHELMDFFSDRRQSYKNKRFSDGLIQSNQ